VSDSEILSPTSDGRRQRSRDSKRKIVTAMLELVREGVIAPTADEVAFRANVGLRTVFRRFKDMESLYAEMSLAISQKVAPLLDEALSHDDWSKNFQQLLNRRLQMYEIIMPYRIAANAMKLKSNMLLSRHSELVRDERKLLRAVLPDFLLADLVVTEALEAALSFDMWNQLRNDQELNVEKATAVVNRFVFGLLPEVLLRKT
jgi:AcrR family transcriptional regulator